MVKGAYVPDRGDVVWLSFDPTSGHEQKGQRPALVISPRIYNAKTHLLVCCPITSQTKGYPFEVYLAMEKLHGVVLSDQVRTLDWKARKAKFIGKAAVLAVEQVSEKLLQLIIAE
jgi:mRNA interferase MazF